MLPTPLPVLPAGALGSRRALIIWLLGAASSTSAFASRDWQAAECDVISSGPVCFNDGHNVLIAGAAGSDLGGHWTFDAEAPFDASGNGNNGVGELEHGPSPAGGGHSAYFEKNFLMVPDSEQLHSKDFTYSFWVYLLGEALGVANDAPKWCPLLRKGVYVSAAEEFSNSPALLYSRRTGHLRAALTTTAGGRGDGEYVDSNARLQPNRWVHIALVHHHGGPASGTFDSPGGTSRMLLYVNGILDARLVTKGTIEDNNFPLYVGGDPFTAEQCGFEMYMDELRMHTRAVAPHELQAEAAPALAGVDPSYVHLGCISCSITEAVASCPHSRHICSSLELHTGGYQVAKALGWLIGGMHVWTHAAVMKRMASASKMLQGADWTGAGGSPSNGLALCCEGAL
mmetsp:Transcript_48482/g.122999  ORF Transcript_48482/g.122999 Transcript_48482/m.122999 type:complete len:399 (+) Transcript_48482:74-1270(+)